MLNDQRRLKCFVLTLRNRDSRQYNTRVNCMERYRIAIDVGGTFTDVVVADNTGRMTIGKGLTTRERIFHGMERGLTVAAQQLLGYARSGRTNAYPGKTNS